MKFENRGNYFSREHEKSHENEPTRQDFGRIGEQILGIGKTIPSGELISQLYEASTLKDKNARPYKGANISIEDIEIGQIRPTQYYTIEENIEDQYDLRKLILEKTGKDTLEMNGGIELLNHHGSEVIIPPVVELDEREGLVLLDGTHRTTLAKKLGKKVMNFIKVTNVSPDFAITKRRLPNEWGEIKNFATLQDLKNARRNGFKHRREGYATDQDGSYRDFSHLTGREKDDRK